jgi:hypothetical protein
VTDVTETEQLEQISQDAEAIAHVAAHLIEPLQAAEATGYTPRHTAASEDSQQQMSVPVASEPTEPTEPETSHAAVRLLPDRDLALSLPGAAARGEAFALRDAAPVRTFLARDVGAKTEERHWRMGADAEVEVARRLTKLGPQWRFLHAVPVGEDGSDIDHLVIGPGGVFTINTKHHADASVWVRGDTFKVNGQNQDYVRNGRFEARRAARLLSAKALFEVDVRAVIAVMGARRGFKIREQPPGGIVTVVTRKEIESHLRSLPPVLEAPSIERIYEVARHLATWHPSTVQWSTL